MPDVIIRDNYAAGDQCLTDGMPWLVPDATRWLDANLRPNDRVLELGMGGSTVFFARRCRWVRSVETSVTWYDAVLQQLVVDGIGNVTSARCGTQAVMEAWLQSLPFDAYSVITVDSAAGFDRSRFLDLLLPRNPSLRLLVMDNYAAHDLFRTHHNWELPALLALFPEPEQWQAKTWNDPQWWGRGTRIFVRG